MDDRIAVEIRRRVTELTDELYLHVGLRARTPALGRMDEDVLASESRRLLVEVLPADVRNPEDRELRDIRLRHITRADAMTIFEYTISHDLAYGTREVDVDVARRLTDDFFGCFDEAAAFRTNGRHDERGRLQGWSPLTRSTLDTGVVAIGHEVIGCVWGEGED